MLCTPLHYDAPNSIEAYIESPEQFPLIIGIVKAGTEIECTKVLGWGTLMWPMSHTVYAEIKDGTFAEISIDICDLSLSSWVKIGRKEESVPYPNWRFFRQVSLDTEVNP